MDKVHIFWEGHKIQKYDKLSKNNFVHISLLLFMEFLDVFFKWSIICAFFICTVLILIKNNYIEEKKWWKILWNQGLLVARWLCNYFSVFVENWKWKCKPKFIHFERATKLKNMTNFPSKNFVNISLLFFMEFLDVFFLNNQLYLHSLYVLFRF